MLFRATCAAAIVLLASVTTAQATCIPSSTAGARDVGRVLLPKTLNAAAAAAPAGGDTTDTSIVGLWSTTFYAGDGPDVWDQAYEQWHSDGTELALDNGVPPVLGNVCVGVWKQEGKTIKLRHVAWNWNPDNTRAGTFVLVATLTVDRGGKTFSGYYITDSFDLDGNVIPELHAEGVMKGTRITVD
jgi:hypothetical protein